ncbi:MAG: CpaF family protein [Candidatus Obscuribacterales bacterium]|nr:CpaF family protein [Candidatus Obscuribacterales bacterium]
MSKLRKLLANKSRTGSEPDPKNWLDKSSVSTLSKNQELSPGNTVQSADWPISFSIPEKALAEQNRQTGSEDLLIATSHSDLEEIAEPVSKESAEATPGKRRAKLSLSLAQEESHGTLSTAEFDAISTYQALKSKIHAKLIEDMDITALMQLDGSDSVESAIEETVHMLLEEERLPLSIKEREKLAQDVLYETLGLGPLEPLLGDPQINDILVNGAHSVWVDSDGKLVETEIRFKDNNHLLHVINRIVSRVGRRVDESSPIVDARLPDGSRVNAIIPPLSMDGPILSIRRFRPTPFKVEDLLTRKALNAPMAEFLETAVKARLNILISGGTSAGKTTLLNVLSGHISDRERIVTIEDTAELRLQQRHVVRLESRPVNIEGRGAISQRELVKNALRMRPDRIVVGEVRGPEALDMLQAMNTGHEGSLTTLHANSPRDALSRLETLVLLSGVELSQKSIREQIGAAFDLVVQIKRLTDGTRRIVSITEVTGVQEGIISLQEIFTFKQHESSGKGQHEPCGIRPSIERKIREAGFELPQALLTLANEKGEAAPVELESEMDVDAAAIVKANARRAGADKK